MSRPAATNSASRIASEDMNAFLPILIEIDESSFSFMRDALLSHTRSATALRSDRCAAIAML